MGWGGHFFVLLPKGFPFEERGRGRGHEILLKLSLALLIAIDRGIGPLIKDDAFAPLVYKFSINTTANLSNIVSDFLLIA